jgi:hypothetical protein
MPPFTAQQQPLDMCPLPGKTLAPASRLVNIISPDSCLISSLAYPEVGAPDRFELERRVRGIPAGKTPDRRTSEVLLRCNCGQMASFDGKNVLLSWRHSGTLAAWFGKEVIVEIGVDLRITSPEPQPCVQPLVAQEW